MSQRGIGWSPSLEAKATGRVEEPAPAKRSRLDPSRAGAWGQEQGSWPGLL